VRDSPRVRRRWVATGMLIWGRRNSPKSHLDTPHARCPAPFCHQPCAPLSSALRRQRPRLARAVQGFPHPERRALADGHALRGTQPGAGQNDPHPQGRALAVVVRRDTAPRRGQAAARSGTCCPGHRLASVGEPALDGGGTVGRTGERGARQSVRLRRLAAAHRPSPRSGIHPPPPRPPQEGRNKVACPHFVPPDSGTFSANCTSVGPPFVVVDRPHTGCICGEIR